MNETCNQLNRLQTGSEPAGDASRRLRKLRQFFHVRERVRLQQVSPV